MRLVLGLILIALLPACKSTRQDSAASALQRVANVSAANDRAAEHDRTALSSLDRAEFKEVMRARWLELQRP